MTDIFQEVDEEVRRDKAAEFWKKYQNHIIAAAVLIVLAAAGIRYWQYEQEQAAQAAGAQFQAAIAAFDAGKPSEAFGGAGQGRRRGARRLSRSGADRRGRGQGDDRSDRRDRRLSTRSPATPRSIRCSATPPAARRAVGLDARRVEPAKAALSARRRPTAPIAAPRG